MLKSVIFIVGIATVLLAGPGRATAADGVLACEGRYEASVFDSADPNERVITSFTLSNFNDVATLSINRIVVYGFDGSTLCDSDEGKFTAGYNIEPNGGRWFNVVPANCSDMPDTSNYNLKIYWSCSGMCKNSPYGKASIRIWETTGGTITAEVGRGVYECRSVK